MSSKDEGRHGVHRQLSTMQVDGSYCFYWGSAVSPTSFATLVYKASKVDNWSR